MTNNTTVTPLAQRSLEDLDVYGRTYIDGGPLVHYDDYAISNAMVNWAVSKKGDYLYNPPKGGPLTFLVFKNLDGRTDEYTKRINEDFNTSFGGIVTNISTILIPDPVRKMWKIEIVYLSKLSGNSNKVTFYTKDQTITEQQSAIPTTYAEVPYTNDNLLNFVLLHQDHMGAARLTYNSEMNQWTWGTYIFINFNTESSNFDEILTLINGAS
jgi:hypothetical protein